MFGRNHFVSPPSKSKYEDLKSGVFVERTIMENYLPDGSDIPQVREVTKMVDVSVPQTPQSGIETRTNDLAFCLSAGVALPDGGAQLSLLGSGNPLADFRIMKSIVSDGERYLSDDKDTEK